jgi:hypothetical protein
MVSHAPPVVMPPPIFSSDWEILAKLASTRSKPLDLDACHAPTWLRWFCGITDKPKSAWFWGPNQETAAVILRPKSPKQSWQFWGSNRETLHHLGFEAQPRNRPPVLRPNQEKIVSASFEVKLLETVAAGFEVKPSETIFTGFEVKPIKTVQVVLRPNHSQTVAIGFKAQTDEKPSEWFWGQTTHKPSTLVLRLNQETRVPRLHVHDADRTRRHPTSRSPGHRVPDLCDHLRSSAPGLLLLPASSSLHAMPHLPPAQHKTSKHDYPNETKIKEKQNESIPDSNSNLANSMTHHNKTTELTTWFLKHYYIN